MINAMSSASKRMYYAGTSRRITGRNKVIALLVGAVLLFGAVKCASSAFAPQGPATANSQGEQTALKGVEKFGNGNIPVTHLTQIGDGFQLIPQAAKGFKVLSSALEQAGHTMTVNSAYRSTATQQAMIDKFGLLADGGRAAPLGQSEHGWGISVDLTLNFEALQWMTANAPGLGFEATIAGEPWHWTLALDFVQ